jgi:hypothetical protein
MHGRADGLHDVTIKRRDDENPIAVGSSSVRLIVAIVRAVGAMPQRSPRQMSCL